MDNEKYLFRRQFIISTQYIKMFAKWNNVSIDNKLFLNVHPDLEVVKVKSDGKIIILLGYILDPFNPSLGNFEIINGIVGKISVADDIFPYIDSMCGRFAIIIKIKDELRIFNDAAGYRQVFYYIDDKNNICCASQPSIIAEKFGFRTDQEIEKDLSQLSIINSDGRWFPGDITLYTEIYHLIPNHYLDLNRGKVKRYWPVKNLEPMTVEKAVKYSAKILKGAIKSASKRYNVALTVTSGYDTRALLAACNKLKDKIHYITHTHSDLNENEPDIQIPRKLLNRYGLKHHIAYHFNNVPDYFHKMFKRNVTGAKDLHNKNAFAFYKYFETFGMEMIVAQGEAGGLGKLFYRIPPIYKVNEKTVATAVGMRGSSIAEQAIKEWLESASKAVALGINILDILYWEMRLGNWSTLAISSYDIVFESLIPFNCKKLMECLISVDMKHRSSGKNVHLGLIKQMWPELLEFPLNPPANIMQEIKGKMRGKGLYRFLKFTYYYLVGSK